MTSSILSIDQLEDRCSPAVLNLSNALVILPPPPPPPPGTPVVLTPIPPAPPGQPQSQGGQGEYA
jgi:hypothetical protein